MRAKILILVFFVATVGLYAQNTINGYKYMIVPKKYDFQKTEDKYQLNSLTKFLFEKEGFATVFEGDEMPEDLFENPCLGLKVNALDASGMLSTKLTIELSDCRNTTVFTSIEGKSKIKQFKKAYHEALRKAFQSVKDINYAYDSSLSSTVKIKQKETTQENNSPIVEEKPLELEADKAKEEVLELDKKEVSEEVIVEEVSEEVVHEKPVIKASTSVEDNILYAQAKPFGYQLVDSAPSVVYLLQKTSIKDVYILKNKNGIIFKRNEQWFAEYYEESVLVQKELSIKF